jgi:N-acetylmuramoyl-L-alanine amidase
LTLHNTTAQTDTIRLEYEPLIKSFSWQQVSPNKIEYYFDLTSDQQWGYDLKYEGTNLIFTLRHPPKIDTRSNQPLKDIKILLDPGHGGKELGARGPNGYPEKSVNLVISTLLKQELLQRGATVYMTRESDKDVSLQDRVKMINNIKPAVALSIHYNALPDNGDAINTAGIGMFWYHPQAEDLSKFLHNYLVEKAKRPSYGVFWNNLALTRPHTTPSVLLELGFMINPTEFEWVTDAQQQKILATTLAEGITEWFTTVQ